MKFKHGIGLFFGTIVTLAIAACGGGAGGGPSDPVAVSPAPSAPTITLALSQSKISLGSTSTLTWSSTNATSCSASGAWVGTQTVSGTSAQTPASSGTTTYTLTCTGAGGTSYQSVALTVPIPVQKSSYENKIVAATSLGPQTIASGDAVAFADFFQDGTYSMITHTLIYNSQDPTSANKLGSIHFWKKINGVWTDNTASLLVDTTGCLHPRKAIVADFNGDGAPDVFFACHGFDAQPFLGEKQHILLSQHDGTYKNSTLPITCFCHGASAADVNGDGYPDIAVVDQFVARTPNFLINNKDGTFKQDLTRLPTSLIDRQIYSAELIDFDKSGKFDLWLAGNEPNATKFPVSPLYTQLPTIYKNDGAGSYISKTPVILPGDTQNGVALDINYINGNIYLLRTSIYDADTTYNTTAIQKISYPSLASSTIYTHSGPYQKNGNANLSGWVNWIIPYQGNIMSLNAMYDVSVPQ